MSPRAPCMRSYWVSICAIRCRNDRHVDADLAAAYFETLRAPKRSCSGSSGPRTMCRSTSRACSTKASCRRFDLLRRVGLLTIQVCGTEDNEPTGLLHLPDG